MTTLKDYFFVNTLNYKGYNILPIILAQRYINYIKKKNKSESTLIEKIGRFIKYSFNILRNIFKKPQVLYNNIFYNNMEEVNCYVINFSPDDERHFKHIHNVFILDSKGIVFTINRKVYLYYKNLKKSVVFFDVKCANKTINKHFFSNFLNLELDYNEKNLIIRAANLVDLLEYVISHFGLPKAIISLQDFHPYDYVFTEFFKNKTNTITLQHGTTSTENEENSIWNFVFSDYIIVWGKEDQKNLEKLGIPSHKIIPLGTAKYDHYFNKNSENYYSFDNSNCVLLSIPPLNLLDKSMIEYIIELIENFAKFKNIELLIRFHPANSKYRICKFLRDLEKRKITNFRVSEERDVVKDILKSKIILANKSGIAYDAMLFNRPVIEYNSNGEDNFYKYRSAVINCEKIEDILKVVSEIFVNYEFNKKILEKQKMFIENYFVLPPNGEKILNFINNLSKK